MNNASKNTEAESTEKRTVTERTPSEKRKSTPNQKRTGRNRDRNTKNSANRKPNRSGTTERPTSASRVVGTVLVDNSFSMESFGNKTTTPGQENYCTSWTAIQRYDDVPDTEPIYNLVPSSISRRTANAMRIDIVPLWGAVQSGRSNRWMNAVMLAATNLKQFIDTSFGTVRNYDPQDLATYAMAASAIFPLIALLKRDLRLAFSLIENQYPPFVPRGLYALLGLTDLYGHYEHGEGAVFTAENLRSWTDKLNQHIITFNRLPMPPELSLFGYNDDLFAGIYLDSPDVQTAQLYAFNMNGYWVYDEEKSDRGAKLTWTEFAHVEGKPHTTRIDWMLDALGDAVSRLTALKTSSNAMLQNLFNAYGSRDTIQIPLLDLSDAASLPFLYSDGILTMIENMVCAPTDIFHIPDVQSRSATNDIAFHIFLQGAAPRGYLWNVPLQFHKPVDDITKEDIGWALRLHPAFLTQRKFMVYDSDHPTGAEEVGITCDGFSGFAIATNCSVARLGNDREIDVTDVSYRLLDESAVGPTMSLVEDFSAHQIYIVASSAGNTVNLNRYFASRDVEVTYRLEDLEMYWVYLTQIVWGADINRNVLGTRRTS